ncbi:hypothetical protein M569_14769 [Genlisea aurea]|uniref:Ribonuclease H2 subunit B n=1 Tax=Genlisea aurea TaxID=192259 RepID=S8BZL9_9LAMI|nr:hypothetical protein M569_14769 [Genlisea aurea]
MSKAPNSCCDGARENRVLIAREPCPIGNSMGKFLSLKHPRTGKAMHYLYNGEVLQELHSFKQAVGSWFLGDYVCEDGRMFTATPVDPVFILLPIFEEARMKKGEDPGKFRQFEDIIFVPGYPGYGSLSSLAAKSMEIVCDLKDVGSSKFFRLNDSKVLKWLCYKVNRLKLTLPTLDKNYAVQDEKPICTSVLVYPVG